MPPASGALREAAQRVIDRVEADRATWQRWHVIAEAQRQLRELEVPVAELDAALEQIVTVALGDYSIVLTRPDPVMVPVELRPADGTSVYDDEWTETRRYIGLEVLRQSRLTVIDGQPTSREVLPAAITA